VSPARPGRALPPWGAGSAFRSGGRGGARPPASLPRVPTGASAGTGVPALPTEPSPSAWRCVRVALCAARGSCSRSWEREEGAPGGRTA